MGDPRWQQARDVFAAALEQPLERRDAFLDQACGAETELRREVASLLAADADARGFLSQPAGLPVPEADLKGRRLGPYRIVGQAGRGGMGLVYRAVRDDDVFQKTVALKLVRAGASPEHLRRLAKERQILARLQHPNIATIFDGGTTEEGQPYLVLEYVDGQPLDAWCNAKGLGMRARLEMFLIICAAVHYAHQSLIVHRDLKPGNILVTAEGQPKLLDFGIAKLLAAGVDPDEAPTVSVLPMMTPAYASPEQVRGLPVTTASDVYSLGVVLYELLTGQRPYALREESLEDVFRAVCATEPRAPSAMLRAYGPTAPASARELRGDIDTIVLKALRKEPERRYLSAQELAEDLRRHLRGLPVLARGDTWAYRSGKFVGRHRVVVGAAVLVLATLVGGLAMTVHQAHIAEANRVRAEKRFADVRRLANSFLFEVHDAIVDQPGTTAARKLVVVRAAEYLDSLAAEAAGDRALQGELAEAYQRLGDAQGGVGEGNVGDTRGALASYAKALDIRRALLTSPPRAADLEALAHLEMKLSRMLVAAGEWQRAEEAARGAIRKLETPAGGGGEDRSNRLASAYHQLGFIQARGGDEAGSFESLRKAVAAGAAFRRLHPEDRAAAASQGRVQSELVERYQRRGEYGSATELARSSRAILEELVSKDPSNTRYRGELVYALNVGSGALEGAGDLAAANRERRRAVDLSEGLLRAEPQNQSNRINLGYALQFLGAGLIRGKETSEGLARLRRAVQVSEDTLKVDPHSAFARQRLAEVEAELGLVLHRLRRSGDEMCAALKAGVAQWEGLEKDSRLIPEDRAWLNETRVALSTCQH